MRCGYTDDYDDELALGRWRAQVASATRGKRGQRFFLDLIDALDALPEKRLIANELTTAEGSVCALGALGKRRGINLSEFDTENYDELGETFDIAHQLAQETMYVNDDDYLGRIDTPEQRWARVRAWAVKQLTPETLLQAEESHAAK